MVAGEPTEEVVRSLGRRLSDYLRWQGGRLAAVPGFCINFLFGRFWNDWCLAPSRHWADGHLPLGRQVAVYVIFPRNGILASHLESLDYLARKGVSVLVVSNLALSPADREALLPHCWRLLERSNYGYDFGGYRDGVLHLLSGGYALERLYLFNDSVWFPVPAHADWIAQVDRQQVDLAGAVSNGGFDHLLGAHEHAQPAWTYQADAPRLHYCSFALCFGARILGDPGFGRYWRSLRITNHKRLTIARGEIGLSRWVIDKGYTHAATLDLRHFDEYLAQLSPDALLELAANLIIPEDPRLRSEQASLVSQARGEAGRDRLIRFVLRATVETGAAYALAHWSLGITGYGFLKKSPLWLSRPTAEITERLAGRYASGHVQAEVQRIRDAART